MARLYPAMLDLKNGDRTKNRPDRLSNGTLLNLLPARNVVVESRDTEFWRSICPQLSTSERAFWFTYAMLWGVPMQCSDRGILGPMEGYFQVGPVVPQQSGFIT